ncbi:hypothetical protein EFM36_10220 [Limosilactobacillus fermentum]|nr:hypothetical protein [Limosilactobacillus fermentum]
MMEYNDKFENRAHRGFKDCHDTLDSMFWNCQFMRAKFPFYTIFLTLSEEANINIKTYSLVYCT